MTDKNSRPTSASASVKLVEGIRLDEIDRTDKAFQVRSGLDETTVQQYMKVAKTSQRLDAFASRPVLWKRDDGKYAIVEGWHRIEAAARLKTADIDADVFEGSRREAFIRAMRSNLTHGLPLKAEEKMTACQKVIEELTKTHGKQPSNGWVAQEMGVSESWVRIHRRQLENAGTLDPADTVVGLDGKEQPARKPSGNSSKARQATQTPQTLPEAGSAPTNAAMAAKPDPPKTPAAKPATAPATPVGKTPPAKTGSKVEQQPSLKLVPADEPLEPGTEDSRIRALREIVPVMAALARDRDILETDDRAEVEQIVNELLLHMAAFLGEGEAEKKAG